MGVTAWEPHFARSGCNLHRADASDDAECLAIPLGPFPALEGGMKMSQGFQGATGTGLDRRSDFEAVDTGSSPCEGGGGGGRLEGVRALVTNGETEVGRAISLAFLQEGARVAMIVQGAGGRSEVDSYGPLVVETDDLRSDVGCRDAVCVAAKGLGGIDVMVNNTASPVTDGPMVGLSEERLVDAFRANVFPLFHLTSAALPYLEHSAAAGIIHTSWEFCYGSPSHRSDRLLMGESVRAFTRSLAGQLESREIRVNTVASKVWAMATGPSPSVNRGDIAGERLRIATSGLAWWECAECYVFLASPSTRHISGQVIQPTCAAFLKG